MRSENSAQYGRWQLRNCKGKTGEVLSGRCQPIQSYSKKPLLLLRIIDHLSGAGRQINEKKNKKIRLVGTTAVPHWLGFASAIISHHAAFAATAE